MTLNKQIRCLARDEASTHNTEHASSHFDTIKNEGGTQGKSLLNFVNVATFDIKAVLAKAAPCKRTVDHRKYLQKQLKKFGSDPSLSSRRALGKQQTVTICTKKKSFLLEQCWTPKVNNFKMSQIKDLNDNFENSINDNVSNDDVENDKKVCSNSEFQEDRHDRHDGSCNQVELNEKASISDVENVPEPKYEQSLSKSKDYQQSIYKSDEQNRFYLSRTPTSQEQGNQSQLTVPLRHRQLPASFWREPNLPKFPISSETSFYPLSTYQAPLGAKSSDLKNYLETTYGNSGRIGLDYRLLSNAAAFDNISNYFSSTNNLPAYSSLPFAGGTNVIQDKGNMLSFSRQSDNPLSYPRLDNVSSFWEQYGLTYPYARAQSSSSLSSNTASQQLWRPIPTKTLSVFPSRYHPFADSK